MLILTLHNLSNNGDLQLRLTFDQDWTIDGDNMENMVKRPIAVDFFSFGFVNDGEASDERIANQIIRLELEESGSDTGSLEGTLEYIMINQLNIDDVETYQGLTTISDAVSFIVIEDLTGSSAPSVTYLDVDTTGTQTQGLCTGRCTQPLGCCIPVCRLVQGSRHGYSDARGPGSQCRFRSGRHLHRS